MQLTAIGTVAVTVALIGAFLVMQSALAQVGDQLLHQIEVSAYLHRNVTPGQARALEKSIAADPHVLSVTYIPKKQGLAELAARTKGTLDLSILTENPLPDKLRIRVRNAARIPAIAASVQRMKGVARVVYGAQIVRRFVALSELVHRLAIGVLILFVLIAAIIVSNTIRLTVFARRREIAIMQLVGATSTYIRLPFICEGLLSGFTGALVAVIALSVARAFLWGRLATAIPWLSLNAGAIHAPIIAAQLLGFGALLGALASWYSVGRYLQVE